MAPTDALVVDEDTYRLTGGPRRCILVVGLQDMFRGRITFPIHDDPHL